MAKEEIERHEGVKGGYFKIKADRGSCDLREAGWGDARVCEGQGRAAQT